MTKKIKFVKKIFEDGTPCSKCAEVEKRLIDAGYMQHISATVVADERDPSSEGMKLANQHNIKLAPFFVVEDDGETRTYTVYFKFVKQELESQARRSLKDMEDTLRANPDLDNL